MVKATSPGHRWEFKSRFRRHAFGWRSQPAVQRVKQAVSEIKAVARRDPVLGADGAVTFLERVSSALENVDSSSGAIGTAVNDDRPPSWSHANHTTPWAEGGPTNVDRLNLLCGLHHGKHHAGYRLRRLKDGRVVEVPPEPTGPVFGPAAHSPPATR